MEWVADYSQRLDAFLGARGHSRESAKRLIRDGQVTVNGAIIKKPSHPLTDGDKVSLAEDAETAEVTRTDIEPTDLKLTILHEDAASIVIAKPAGIAVHPGSGMPEDEVTILHGLAHLFRERGLPFSPGSVLVHRLDKETTGCLLIAKDEPSYVALQRQFKNRTVEKTYLALVAGVPNPPAATVDAPVGRNLTDRTKMSVLRTSVSREARTTYRTLAAGNDVALLRCDLHTGRTHQIRVHLRAIGHPVLGDQTYTTNQATAIAEELHIGTLCLHAWRTTFSSPATGLSVHVEAPLPETFQRSLKAAGLHAAPLT